MNSIAISPRSIRHFSSPKPDSLVKLDCAPDWLAPTRALGGMKKALKGAITQRIGRFLRLACQDQLCSGRGRLNSSGTTAESFFALREREFETWPRSPHVGYLPAV